MRTLQSSRKRPLFVNGVFCESITAGARMARLALGRDVSHREILGALKGQATLPGVSVTEKRQEKKAAIVRETLSPLLLYPYKERPLDRGLPRLWC